MSVFNTVIERALKTFSGAGASQFSELLTVERTPVYERNATFGVSAIRDRTSTTGTGASVALDTSEILLSSGTDTNGEASISTKNLGRYIPGYSGEFGMGIRFTSALTENAEAKWGAQTLSGDDGVYFGRDATGFFCAYKKNGTEVERAYQSEWNIDPMNSKGESEINLNPTDGNIFQIVYSYYGYGVLLFGIVSNPPGDPKQIFSPCHFFRPRGETSLDDPNLSIFTEISNNGDTTNNDLYLGGRQFSIVGKFNPIWRTTSQARDTVGSISTTAVPLVAFRKKSSFTGRTFEVDGIEAIVSSAPVILELRIGATLSGGVNGWVTPTGVTAAETALETDLDSTGVTGGEVIYSFLQSSNRESVPITTQINIPEDEMVVLTARTLSGTASVVSNLRLKEEW